MKNSLCQIVSKTTNYTGQHIKKTIFLITSLALFYGCAEKDNSEVVIDQDYYVKPNKNGMAIFHQGDFAYSCLAEGRGDRVYFYDCNILDANGVTKKNLKFASIDDGKEGTAAKQLQDGTLFVKKGTKLKLMAP